MGNALILGGGGGIDTGAITATTADVLSGKKFADSDGNIVDGALALSGNASNGNVLNGKTFYNTDAKQKQTGSMANRGAVAPTALKCGASYTVQEGYHNGSGKVTADSLYNQTRTDSGKTPINSAQVLTGYQGWVDGSKITGSMADQGAKTSSLNCGASYIIPAGYHNGSGRVTANSLASQTVADATSSQILTGKTAWVNGVKITGSMPNYYTGQKVFNGAAFGGLLTGAATRTDYRSMRYSDGLPQRACRPGATPYGYANPFPYIYFNGSRNSGAAFLNQNGTFAVLNPTINMSPFKSITVSYFISADEVTLYLYDTCSADLIISLVDGLSIEDGAVVPDNWNEPNRHEYAHRAFSYSNTDSSVPKKFAKLETNASFTWDISSLDKGRHYFMILSGRGNVNTVFPRGYFKITGIQLNS